MIQVAMWVMMTMKRIWMMNNIKRLTFNFYVMIRKLKSGEYRLYSRKKDAKTNKRRNLGTFSSLEGAKKHEREVQYFKRH